jgi:hypothetical protein
MAIIGMPRPPTSTDSSSHRSRSAPAFSSCSTCWLGGRLPARGYGLALTRVLLAPGSGSWTSAGYCSFCSFRAASILARSGMPSPCCFASTSRYS